MIIDKTTYCFDDQIIKKKIGKKTKIILTYSLRSADNKLKNIVNITNEDKLNSCPTFTINRLGGVYQHYDPESYVNYIKLNNIDTQSIIVELENLGPLKYHTGQYINWINESCTDDLVFKKVWKGVEFWELHTREQLDSTFQLCKYLCETYSIEKKCLGYNNFDDTAFGFSGIISKSNIQQDAYDVNPHFNKYFHEMIKYIET